MTGARKQGGAVRDQSRAAPLLDRAPPDATVDGLPAVAILPRRTLLSPAHSFRLPNGQVADEADLVIGWAGWNGPIVVALAPEAALALEAEAPSWDEAQAARQASAATLAATGAPRPGLEAWVAAEGAIPGRAEVEEAS